MRAEGEIYNVWDERGIIGHGPDWCEYRMSLTCECGGLLDDWDSFYETYNGVQQLTRAECARSVAEVVTATENGQAGDWFTVPAHCPNCKRSLAHES